VTGPGHDQQYVTLEDKVSLQGLVLGEVEGMRWEEAGAEGEIEVKDGRWTTSDIPLVSSTTAITITATRGDEHTTETMRVYRNREVVFVY